MKVIINNARLSFPSLFKTEEYGGADTGKYGATFLIPKSDEATIKAIKAAMKEVAEAEFGKPLPKNLGTCLKDGDDKEYDGYADHYSIKATTKRRPVLVNRDKSPIAEDDGILYAGCYVNASLDIWAMNNQYGKKVLASLNGIQFARDGESFGASNDSMDDFDELEPATADAGEPDPFA